MKSPRFEFKADFSPDELKLLAEKSSQSIGVSSTEPPHASLGAFIVDPASVDKEHPTLLGGIYAELSDAWLYIDLLWVEEKWRGTGYGVRLMQIVEQAAVERGVNRAFLGTSSFQAPQFYRRLGYVVIGEMPAVIPDHSLFLLAREPLTPYELPLETEIVVEDAPNESLVEQLGEKLRSFNQSYTGVIEQSTLGGMLVYDESELLIGGGIAWRFGQWFGIQSLSVDLAWQGQGYETEIIHRLETMAAGEGNLIGMVRTYRHETAEWYRAAGYQDTTHVADYPAKGKTSWVLTKSLG